MSSKTQTTATKERAKPALVPKLRFPKFQDTEEWKNEALGQLADYENGKAYEQDILENGKYVVVNSRFISTDGAVRKYTSADYLIAKAGEVLMVLSDLPKGRALAKCYFVESDDRYAVNQRVCRLKPRRIDGKFLYYTLNRHPRLLAYDDGLSQTHLSKGGVIECQLCVPTQKSEQQKIAECLSSVDELMAAQARKVDVLKTHKKGLMQQLFPREGETQPRLRFPEFQNAGEWETKPFEEFVTKSFYGTSSSTSLAGKYPVLRMGNMVDGGLDFKNLVYLDLDADSFESFRLEDGDILLNRTNSPALVGKISIFQLKSECMTASYIVTYRLNKKRIDPSFCNSMLNTPLYQSRIRSFARPSVSQANINPTTFKKELIVAVPSLPEQQRIATCLSSLDALITAETQKLEALKTHKKGLMQQLFPSLEQQNTL